MMKDIDWTAFVAFDDIEALANSNAWKPLFLQEPWMAVLEMMSLNLQHFSNHVQNN